jgi:hypothetical protein
MPEVARAAHKDGERTLGYKGTKAKSRKQKADPSALPPHRPQKRRALGTPAPLRMTARDIVRFCIPTHARPAYTEITALLRVVREAW